MILDVALIGVGLITTIVLAFASHDSKAKVLRVIFWICLSVTAGIIIWSGVSSIHITRDLTHVRKELSASNKRIKQLKQENKQLGHGVTLMYEFDGCKRSSDKPGQYVLNTNGQSIFRDIQKLRNQGKWVELLYLCEEQMRERPQWLTPYLFAGVAQINLGNTSRALDLLEFVNKESAGKSDYSEAGSLLAELRNKK